MDFDEAIDADLERFLYSRLCYYISTDDYL